MSETPFRVGNAERAHAVAQLEQQGAAGRLTDAEVAQRRTKAEAAVYDTDLDALFRDIPGGLTPLPSNTWETLPGGPSGVADTAYPHQELAAAQPSGMPATEPLRSYRGERDALRSDYKAERRELRAEHRAERRELHAEQREGGAPSLWFIVAALYAFFGVSFCFMPWQAAMAGILMTTFVATPVVNAAQRRRNQQLLEARRRGELER